MPPDPLSAFLSSLGTVGPVGLTVLGGWYMWLKYGRPAAEGAAEETPNPPPSSTWITSQATMHTENRDMLRDIHSVTTRTLAMEERANESLARVAEQCRLTADVLERLEERLHRGKRP